MARITLDNIILRAISLDDEIDSGAVHVPGTVDKMPELVSPLDAFGLWFNALTRAAAP